jgi:hypothetical protein
VSQDHLGKEIGVKTSAVTRIIRTNAIARYADFLGALILMGLAWWLDSKSSLIIAGVAALLISGRFILMAFVEEKVAPLEVAVREMGRYIDLSGRGNSADLESLIRAYGSVTDREFIAVKDALIGDAIEKLRKIASEKTSDELGRGDYYQWLLPILDGAQSGEMIRAISMMSDSEWDDSPEEKRFVAGNISAAKRQAHIERIFIVKQGQLEKFLSAAEVAIHFEGREPRNLQGYFIEYELLKRRDSALLEAVGHGFIDFNGRVALVDNFSETGEIRGQVTKNPAELKRIREVFSKLKNMANEMDNSSIEGIRRRLQQAPPPKLIGKQGLPEVVQPPPKD